MDVKKLALELLVKVNLGDVTLEQLNSELAELKEQMSEIGDEGSEEFKEAAKAVEELEGHISTVNKELGKTKDNFNDTADAQKKAAQGSGIFAKGVKAVGTAFKALGIGAIVAGLKFLFDALSQNQRVMDAVNTATEAISIVFAKVVDVVTSVVDRVSKASEGFEGLKNVMSGLLTLAITPLKLAFYEIQLALQVAQLAWEKSFFGGGDEAKIKELNESIDTTANNIKETAVSAVEAGSQIVSNLGKAASEIGQVVEGSIEGISKISIKAAIEQGKANVELKNSAELAAAQQGLLIEQYDRQAEKQRQIRDEERNSIDDRIAANDELGKVLEDQEKAMLAQADLQIAAAQAQVDKNRNTETEIALVEALANKAGVLAQVEGFRSEQKVNDLALDREKMQMLRDISQSESDLAYDRERFNAEQIEDKLQSLEAIRDLENERQREEEARLQALVLATNNGTQAQIDAIKALDEFKEQSRQANIEAEKAVLDEIAARQKEEAANEKMLQEQKVELAQSALTSISNLTKALAAGDEESQRKAFQVNKALGLGQAIISTATGITNAYANPVDVASGVAFVKSGIIAASGAAQIATIARTQFEGGNVSNPQGATNPTLGGGNVGTQPRGFTPNLVQPDVPTTKVIVTETDIRKATSDISGIYNKAIVVE